jgi:hypothetical protein
MATLNSTPIYTCLTDVTSFFDLHPELRRITVR